MTPLAEKLIEKIKSFPDEEQDVIVGAILDWLESDEVSQNSVKNQSDDEAKIILKAIRLKNYLPNVLSVDEHNRLRCDSV